VKPITIHRSTNSLKPIIKPFNLINSRPSDANNPDSEVISDSNNNPPTGQLNLDFYHSGKEEKISSTKEDDI
jgi:hypothetical protein